MIKTYFGLVKVANEPGYHRMQLWYTKNGDTPTGGFG